MKRKRLNKIKGFTLVELLVVVAIIAILSVIGLTIFTSAQSNARDARRKADIEAIANAIETNRTPGSVYYTVAPSNSQFSGSIVPIDSNRKYCLKTSTDGTVVADPLATITTASWTTACPSTWTEVTNGMTLTAKSTNFKVCASLESTSLTFYCKPSAQ